MDEQTLLEYEPQLDELLQTDLPEVLFYTEEVDSMEFCMPIGKSEEESRVLKKFQKVVESCGGSLTFNMSCGGQHLIKFVNSKCINFLSEDDLFISNYLIQCVKASKLLDLNNFRASETKFTNAVNVMDILNGTISWEEAERLQTGEEVSDFSDKEDEANLSTTSKVTKKMYTTSKYYSMEEEKRIINFITKNSYYSRVKGNSIWQRMEQKRVCGSRTWQSMRGRYLSHIIPKIKNFQLDPMTESKLVNPFKGGLDESFATLEAAHQSKFNTNVVKNKGRPAKEMNRANATSGTCVERTNSEEDSANAQNDEANCTATSELTDETIVKTTLNDAPSLPNGIPSAAEVEEKAKEDDLESSQSIPEKGASLNENTESHLRVSNFKDGINKPLNLFEGFSLNIEKATTNAHPESSSGSESSPDEANSVDTVIFNISSEVPVENNTNGNGEDPKDADEIFGPTESSTSDVEISLSDIFKKHLQEPEEERNSSTGSTNSPLNLKLDDEPNLQTPLQVRTSPRKCRPNIGEDSKSEAECETSTAGRVHSSKRNIAQDDSDADSDGTTPRAFRARATKKKRVSAEAYELESDSEDSEGERRLRRRRPERDKSDDGDSESEQHTKPGTPFLRRLKTKNYHHKDDIAILNYIYDNKVFGMVKGRAVWEIMAKTQLVPGRSWHSLKERFRKRILPRMDSYKSALSPKFVKDFLRRIRERNEESEIVCRLHTLKYTVHEDDSIINFIVDNKRYKELKGKSMWVSMSRHPGLKSRTWESLKNRFLKNILPCLSRFELTSDQRRSFEIALKGKSKPRFAKPPPYKKKVKSDTDTDNDTDTDSTGTTRSATLEDSIKSDTNLQKNADEREKTTKDELPVIIKTPPSAPGSAAKASEKRDEQEEELQKKPVHKRKLFQRFDRCQNIYNKTPMDSRSSIRRNKEVVKTNKAGDHTNQSLNSTKPMAADAETEKQKNVPGDYLSQPMDSPQGTPTKGATRSEESPKSTPKRAAPMDSPQGTPTKAAARSEESPKSTPKRAARMDSPRGTPTKAAARSEESSKSTPKRAAPMDSPQGMPTKAAARIEESSKSTPKRAAPMDSPQGTPTKAATRSEESPKSTPKRAARIRSAIKQTPPSENKSTNSSKSDHINDDYIFHSSSPSSSVNSTLGSESGRTSRSTPGKIVGYARRTPRKVCSPTFPSRSEPKDQRPNAETGGQQDHIDPLPGSSTPKRNTSDGSVERSQRWGRPRDSSAKRPRSIEEQPPLVSSRTTRASAATVLNTKTKRMKIKRAVF